MAEIIENMNHEDHIPTGRINAGLTLGIIGTALSAINGAGGIFSLMGGKGSNTSCGAQAGITNEELYLERSQCQNYLDTTKRYYEGKIEETDKMNTAFFRLYKNDVDNAFSLYKGQRDSNDILASKINEVDKKVDIMAAIRPYQDALIDNKIEKAELMAQYNLDRRTCRMISGQLVLPSTPTVTGYGSYCYCMPTTSPTNPTV